MHRAYAPFARWGSSQQARRPPFMTGAELSGPASHRIRASVKLTHPCQFAAAHLPCTRPPDILYGCRPRALPGPRDRALARAFAVTRSGTDTMPRREGEDEIAEDAAPAPAVTGADAGPGLRHFRRSLHVLSATAPSSSRLRAHPSCWFTHVGRAAGRPRTPGRIHSEDHIISQRFSPPSTGCISGGHTSLSLYW